jgi:uncharacterized protein
LPEVFVDTSFVVALVNRSDQYHTQALELASLFDRRELVVTDAVLLEIGNALARSFKAASIQILSDFLTSDEVRIVHLNAELFQRAFEMYKSHGDKTWGLVDCISFVVMKDLNLIDSLTADRHFEQAGFRVLMAKDVLTE